MGGTEKIPEKDEIEEFARSLPSLVNNAGSPSVFSYSTRSYCSLPHVELQEKCPKIDQAAIVLEKISSNLHKAYTVRDEIEFISQNPSHFLLGDLGASIKEMSVKNGQDLSLIHISEPTRPY